MTGTPKTLIGAIGNGIDSINDSEPLIDPDVYASIEIHVHVEDFLRQKFAVSYLKNNDNPQTLESLKELLEEILGKKEEEEHEWENI